jgi:hypothetical protein
VMINRPTGVSSPSGWSSSTCESPTPIRAA